MQQPVSRRDVYSPSLSASIGGRDVELVSASMDRSLPDPLAGGSLTAASGELVAVEGADVARTVATPWDPGTSWPRVRRWLLPCPWIRAGGRCSWWGMGGGVWLRSEVDTS